MMRVLFCPDDWLGRHPHLCMAVLGLLICIVGGING